MTITKTIKSASFFLNTTIQLLDFTIGTLNAAAEWQRRHFISRFEDPEPARVAVENLKFLCAWRRDYSISNNDTLLCVLEFPDDPGAEIRACADAIEYAKASWDSKTAQKAVDELRRLADKLN